MAAVTWILTVWPASADDASGLSSTDPTLVLTSAASATATQLCNSTARAVTLRARLPTVALKIDPPSAAGGLIHVTVPRSLGAGGCASLTIKLSTGGRAAVAGIDAGASVTTALDVVSNGAGAVSVPITLEGRAAAKHTLLGPLGDVSLSASCSFWRPGKCDSATSLDSTIVLGYADSAPPVVTGAFPISNGHDIAMITLSQDTQSGSVESTALRARVAISGVRERGTYKGVLVLGDSSAEHVPVTVTVADPIAWLIIFALLGTVLAVVAKIAAGRWRFVLTLGRARNQLPSRYRSATVLAGVAARFPGPTDEIVRTFTAANRAALVAYLKTTLTVDPADPAFADVRGKLAGAFADAAVFHDRLPESLESLNTAVSTLFAFVSEWQPDLARPALVADARTLLRMDSSEANQPALGVGAATRTADRADELVQLVAAWTAGFTTLRLHQQWREELLAKGPDAHETARLDDAEAALARALGELVAANTAAGIEAVRTGPDARRAHTALMIVGAAHQCWLPLTLAHIEPPPSHRAYVDRTLLASSSPPAPVEQRWAVEDAVAAVLAPVITYVSVVGTRLAEWLIVSMNVALGLATAGFATWHTLYEGQPFGSFSDFVAVTLAGIAATAVVDAVVSGANWLRGGLSTITK